MAKKDDRGSKKKGPPEEKLTDDQDFKKAYPKQVGKTVEPKEPPPDPRPTDPRRKPR